MDRVIDHMRKRYWETKDTGKKPAEKIPEEKKDVPTD